MIPFRSKSAPILIAAGLAISLTAISPGFAAGDGDATPITPSCKKGKVWDKKKKKCIVIKKSSRLDDENIYVAGRDLAIRGRFDEAIAVLSNARNRNDPRVLNYLGYAHRKAGRIEVGLGYYREALRIDPDYTRVREYMGEAFLQKGDVDSARGQLAEIEKRCGRNCDEYAKLALMIDRHRTE